MTKLRTDAERQVGANIQRIFTECPDSVELKLENFPKYVRRQHLKRFLALYEIFKLVLPIKGSIVECGVFRGFGVMSWAKLSAILEPENLTRRIYGFDTFAGFPGVHDKDQSGFTSASIGELSSNSHDELLALLAEHDADRGPRERDEPRGHLPVFRDQARGECERAGISTEHVRARLGFGRYVGGRQTHRRCVRRGAGTLPLLTRAGFVRP